ncbi:hypothetical protein [Zhihengliuella sp.]|uniref:hypothetical protein n=1 Tax=Zhihengliuella sp. TaxID=1954483 RepID=UPI00281246D2|nr:hypothetical protein [Zhihengliuella sp.]
MSQRPSPPRSAPSGRGAEHDGGSRPSRPGRLARGLRQLAVFAILALIIVALGTTAVTGGPRDPETLADPSVEQHVAALAAGGAALGDELPAAVREAVSRQSDLVGPPQTVEPLFPWLPESEPREPVIPPAGDVAVFADQLEASARAVVGAALAARLDPSSEDARDPASVPPERLRTLVAVALEQVQALELLDADRAHALRAELGSTAMSSAAPPSASPISSGPDAPASPESGSPAEESAGPGSQSAESRSPEPQNPESGSSESSDPTSGRTASESGSPTPSRSAPVPEQVATAHCAPVVAAADAAYRTAYLYEYTAVRSGVAWPDGGIVPATPAESAGAGTAAEGAAAPPGAGPGLDEPLATSPLADPAAWWPTAERREALGDRLADLLPQGCVAVREPAYAAPADPELPDALAQGEVQLALALRDAAAAAPVSQRGWLLAEALAGSARATEDPWLTLTAPAAED